MTAVSDSRVPPAGSGPYAMDNHHEASQEHHHGLAGLLDGHTRRRITELRSLAGATCLEIGAGGGSVSVWLAEQVGADGTVVATDVKPDHVPAHPSLTTVAHDLTSADPWPEPLRGPFDLIVGRLVLSHLPQRRRILSQLVNRLAPGGTILLEDWAAWQEHPVVTAPTPAETEVYARHQKTMSKLLMDSGVDREWARRKHLHFLEEKLRDVETVIHCGYWYGGSPGCKLLASVARQLRLRLLEAGLTSTELDTVQRLYHDERLVIHGHPLYSTSGVLPD